MFTQLFNWRTLLAVIAIAIVTGTVFYSSYLAKKIAGEEREKVNQWVEAGKLEISAPENTDFTLPRMIKQHNTDIPIIMTNEKDSIVDFRNLDSAKAVNDPDYLPAKLKEFKATYEPVLLRLNAENEPFVGDKYYYGESELLKEVRYYPLIQLLIVALFIIITLVTISTRNKSNQNKVWAGMAKEAAHQLGTPLSSLEGWIEILKETEANGNIAGEMEKDVNRLKLVSDRFGKIGSTPQLEEKNVAEQVQLMVNYIKRRATDKVSFIVHTEPDVPAMINAPLFDWVIENLLKNALDAMEGKGAITITIKNEKAAVLIDIADTGKGISKANLAKVFKPGFTTKKRGWGLGLSLSKRIMEQYHKGELFVKQSDPGKGTTFRIILKR
jgi:signal transduction histidine kinase